mmetsp:Transcript_3133/g.4623  ORF Transcript_3133/g.4623 Transcript_3133/m.4623 type:complete len:474 (-) Transcript_3133:1147-2568(-)
MEHSFLRTPNPTENDPNSSIFLPSTPGVTPGGSTPGGQESFSFFNTTPNVSSRGVVERRQFAQATPLGVSDIGFLGTPNYMHSHDPFSTSAQITPLDIKTPQISSQGLKTPQIGSITPFMQRGKELKPIKNNMKSSIYSRAQQQNPATTKLKRSIDLPSLNISKSRKKSASTAGTPKSMTTAPKNRFKDKYNGTPVHTKPDITSSRAWRIIEPSGPLASEFKFEITSKTRCEKATPTVDEKLYSSLKYVIATNIECPPHIQAGHECLIGKCTVVDTDDGDKEILKDDKVILNGQHDAAFSRTQKGFSGQHKVQFTDCGYHHNQHHFAWRISFCVPKDLNNPILVVQSAPFIVYARRPKREKSTKTSKKKATALNPFETFTKKLADLLTITKKMSTEEKKSALDMVMKQVKDIHPKDSAQVHNLASIFGVDNNTTTTPVGFLDTPMVWGGQRKAGPPQDHTLEPPFKRKKLNSK